jgi:hypothetical protein
MNKRDRGVDDPRDVCPRTGRVRTIDSPSTPLGHHRRRRSRNQPATATAATGGPDGQPTVTFEADSSCEQLPEVLRTRTAEASIGYIGAGLDGTVTTSAPT